MTELDLAERFRPPDAPVEMPFQVLERQPAARRLIAVLRLATGAAARD